MRRLSTARSPATPCRRSTVRVRSTAFRIGVLGDYFTARLEPDVAALVDAARERLAAAGAVIEEVALAHAETIAPVYLTIVLAEAAAYHGETLERMPERYSPGVRQRLEAGRYVLAEDYLRALRGRDVLRAIVDGALGAYRCAARADASDRGPVIGTVSVTIDGVAEPVRNLMLRLTQPFNVTGHPAISIPCGMTTGRPPSRAAARRQTRSHARAARCRARVRTVHSWRVSGVAGRYAHTPIVRY